MKGKVKVGGTYAVTQRVGPVHGVRASAVKNYGGSQGVPGGKLPPRLMLCVNVLPNGRYLMEYESWSWGPKDANPPRPFTSAEALVAMTTKAKQKVKVWKRVAITKGEILGTWDAFQAGRFVRGVRGWREVPLAVEQQTLAS